MKMAIKDGQVLLAEVDSERFMIIKSWGKMRWSKTQQILYGPADAELLNRLSGIFFLPKQAEDLRQKLNRRAEAVDAERMNKNPKALYPYPVKLPLYQHQLRGANMAMMAFGLIDPPEGSEKARKDFEA